jgi:hypothetical protein
MACYHVFSDVLANADLGHLKCDYFRVRRHPGLIPFLCEQMGKQLSASRIGHRDAIVRTDIVVGIHVF